MSGKTKKPNPKAAVAGSPSDRIIERGRGCWNCVKWDQEGHLSEKHLRHRAGEDMKILVAEGLSRNQTFDSAKLSAKTKVERSVRMIRSNTARLCLGGGSKADFTFPAYLCDKWTGRVVVEGALDKLPEELRADLGEDPKS